MSKKKRLRRSALPPTRWAGLEVLHATHGLNARCMELIADTARAEGAQEVCRAVFGFQDLWARMDTEACARAGRCPVLLLNLNLDSADWWSHMRIGTAPILARAPAALFATDRAAPLIREILTEARGVARSQPRTARLVFGMESSVSVVVAALSASDIERIAVEHAKELRPRWDNTPMFWRQLLEAAVGTDARVTAKLHLHCIQLLGSGLALRYG